MIDLIRRLFILQSLHNPVCLCMLCKPNNPCVSLVKPLVPLLKYQPSTCTNVSCLSLSGPSQLHDFKVEWRSYLDIYVHPINLQVLSEDCMLFWLAIPYLVTQEPPLFHFKGILRRNGCMAFKFLREHGQTKVTRAYLLSTSVTPFVPKERRYVCQSNCLLHGIDTAKATLID